MKEVVKHCSPLPWSIIQNGEDGNGWSIVDANENTVCDLWMNEGNGIEDYDCYQLNAVLIVELVNGQKD